MFTKLTSFTLVSLCAEVLFDISLVVGVKRARTVPCLYMRPPFTLRYRSGSQALSFLPSLAYRLDLFLFLTYANSLKRASCFTSFLILYPLSSFVG